MRTGRESALDFSAAVLSESELFDCCFRIMVTQFVEFVEWLEVEEFVEFAEFVEFVETSPKLVFPKPKGFFLFSVSTG